MHLTVMSAVRLLLRNMQQPQPFNQNPCVMTADNAESHYAGVTLIARVMKLTAFFFIVLCVHVHAKGVSQTITLSGKNMAIEKIFSAIEDQTGYVLFFSKSLVKDAHPVSLSVQNMKLTDFLEIALKDQSLNYRITDRTIMLSRASAPSPATIDAGLNQQPADISGRVVHEGKPVAGASVNLSPGDRGAATNDNGFYILNNVLPGTYTLTISSIGFKKVTKKIVITDAAVTMNISMELATNEQEEIIVSTGYSTKKTGELTGSVQRISGEEIRRGITTSDPASMLKGRVTGLYIAEQRAGDPTSSGGQIFVRGQSSIASVGVDQANEYIMPTLNYGPLLVLDGVIMPNQNLKDLVTPQDIEDITILKDAAATAIYGSRAAGGVIVVNTKKGRMTKPRLNAEVKYGLNVPNRGTFRFLNGQELYDMQKEYFTEDYRVNNPSLLPLYPTLQSYLTFKLPAQADVDNSFDWQKYGFINSNTKEVNISAGGGNDKTRYYMGASYYNEQSTGVHNGLDRKTFRLNLESHLSDRLTASVSLNGIFNDGQREYRETGVFLYSYIPWGNPYNADGTLKPALSYKQNGSVVTQANPLFDNQYNNTRLRSQLIFGSIKLDYRLTDWLSFSSVNTMNLNYAKNETYADVQSFAGSRATFAPQGFLGTNTNNLSSYLSSNQLSFRKTFGQHSLRALAAIEYGKTTNETMVVNVNNVRAGYPVISLGRLVGNSNDLSSLGIVSSKAGNVEGGKEERAVYSMFGEAGYTFRERYSLSASLRRDASSSFGKDERYGTFYSAGAAWILSRENFMSSVKWISNLKLRANYGTSGSQLGDNFLTRTLYRPGVTYNGQTGAVISVLGNPDLRWEITKTSSAGVDIGLFNRITATIDVYSRRSDDLIQKVSLPSISGFPTQWQNVASVRNTGLEVLITSENIVRKNFRWTTSFNTSFNRNEIVKVAKDSLRQGFYTANSYYLFKGEDINMLKAVKYAGVDPETGKPRFEKLIFDSKGAVTGITYVNTQAAVGVASDSRQMQAIGSYQPKYYGGITNTFTYRQLSLSVLITYALKYIVVDALAQQNQGTNITSYNQAAYRDSQKPWTTPGQTDATEPMFYYHATTDYFGSSKYMHDGSNASLRNVRLSYDLPASVMKKLNMSGCTFYISGDNLYTIYSKDLVAASPEGPTVGTAQNFGTSVGSSIGIPRRYVFGLQVNF